MYEYAKYTKGLKKLLVDAGKRTHVEELRREFQFALDGQASEELRAKVPLEKRRRNGAFFTGEKLSRVAAEILNPSMENHLVLLDPACGVGNLLIACSQFLPVKETLTDTIDLWSIYLHGYDLHKEFVEAAKIRLIIAAVQRGASVDNDMEEILATAFPGIVLHNGLNVSQVSEKTKFIILNPPYNMLVVNKACSWASGKVTSAAVFLETYVEKAKPGTQIVAILPEVLRTGERYKKWRSVITSKARIVEIKVFGQFDEWTDIDVFMMKLTIPNVPAKQSRQLLSWHNLKMGRQERVANRFDVNVGAVVPYRDSEEGNTFDYLFPRNATPWRVLEYIKEKRKFNGRVFKPPFVVVRRTSRPGDNYRAVGTIVSGTKLVAVENHLLVLLPKKGTLKECKRLLMVLRRKRTNNWLNARIRCRHLTVSSLKELPFEDS